MKSNRWPSNVATLLVLMGSVMLVGHLLADDAKPDEWKAPARAAAKKNPVPADANSIAAGKVVYVKQCLSCHGAIGKGDGPAAAALGADHHPGDLPSPKTQQQSDGALFWKITEGRKPMPTFDKLTSEDERWQVINYIRTLAKKPDTK